MPKYEKIPILKAARKCGLVIDTQTRERREVEAKCPFCGDKPRRYHLRMNTDSDRFMCWLCGETGNSVSLYAKLEGVSNAEAARELLLDSNVYRFPSVPQSKVPSKREALPLAQRHAVYTAMLSHLMLSDEHRDNLRERGMSDERSERNEYRSLPARHDTRLRLAAMLSDFYDLDGIPGFFLNSHGKWDIAGAPGLLIPYRNPDSLIQGLQVRIDNAEYRKYRWLASTNYNRGTKCGTHIHVTGNLAADTVYITEGGLKGDVASFLDDDALFACIAGVSAIDGLRETVAALTARNIVIALDMDKLENPRVLEAIDKIAKQLRKIPGTRIRVASWDAHHKGIDDYYYARNRINIAPLQLLAA